MRKLIGAAVAVIIATFPGAGMADPGKDESGKRQFKAGKQFAQDRRGRDREVRGIPKGHMPPPGECRRWDSSRPAGHQPPPYRC